MTEDNSGLLEYSWSFVVSGLPMRAKESMHAVLEFEAGGAATTKAARCDYFATDCSAIGAVAGRAGARSVMDTLPLLVMIGERDSGWSCPDSVEG